MHGLSAARLGSRGRWCAAAIAALAATMLGGCGGGSDSRAAPGLLDPVALDAAQCRSLDDQKAWLRSYMDGAYYWYANIPATDASAYPTIDAYFEALKWAPADRYSFALTELEYQQLFQAGVEISHGIEWKNDPAQASAAGDPGPIRVAYVESASPAAQGGIVRGDTLVSVNGAAPTTDAIIDLLYPTEVGVPITLELRANGSTPTRTVALVSAAVTRHAVFDVRTLTAGGGTRIGYLALNQFLAPGATLPALRDAFRTFRQAGIADLVLDLRYNGGGYISMANETAAMIAGTRVTSKDVFISYRYNAKNTAANEDYRFLAVDADTALSLPRVVVLTTHWTASASELVINSLKPYANVIQIGTTSYGKPVGQLPVTDCGWMFAPIVFETVNAQGAGAYFEGIAPTCTVLDDLDHPLGDVGEALLGNALSYLASGSCAPASAQAQVARRAPAEAASAALPVRASRRALLR